jgi:hypothetical protein
VRAIGSGYWRSQCRPTRSIGKYSGALPRSLKNQTANDKPTPIRSIGITRGAFGPDVGARYYYEMQFFLKIFLNDWQKKAELVRIEPAPVSKSQSPNEIRKCLVLK